MRVLQVMATGAVSGGARHLLCLLPSLASVGVQCRAAVGSDGPLAAQLRAVGVDAGHVQLMGSRLDARAPWRLAQLLDEGYDLVHWHGTRAAFFGALARPLCRRAAPAVYTVHGLSYRKEKHRLRRRLFFEVEGVACASSSHVIAVAKADLEELRRFRFVDAEASSYLPNPVDVERFSAGSRAHARRDLGIDPERLLIGTVARLVVGKGVADLLFAVAKSNLDATLIVAGDGPERLRLEALARELGVNARFLGTRHDVPEVLAALDMFVLPSHWEGEPVALLEAMAAGLPCVATATPGAVELLGATQAAELVPIGDCAALAGALLRMAQLSKDERQRRGEAGRMALGPREPQRIAMALRGIYASVMAARGVL